MASASSINNSIDRRPSEINSLFVNSQTKDRSVNFTRAEVDRLQSLITKHQNVLFCKKTDAISSKQKDSAWTLIEGEFNALGETPRTVKQLKYKFENMKRVAKKVASTERQEMRRTGGGPPPTPPGRSDAETTDWLNSVMSTAIHGHEATFDDDVISKSSKTVFPPNHQEEITIQIIDHDDTVESHLGNETTANELTPSGDNKASETKEKWHFDASTPYTSLKRPMSSPLKRRIKKQKAAENCNIVRQTLREKKIALLDSLQDLELQKIRDSIRNAQELHEQELRHKEERHELEKEKIILQTMILKKSLE